MVMGAIAIAIIRECETGDLNWGSCIKGLWLGRVCIWQIAY